MFKRFKKSVKRHWKSIVTIAVVAVVTLATGGIGAAVANAVGGALGTVASGAVMGGIAGFTGGVVGAKLNGASWKDALKSGAKGALVGAVSGGVAAGVVEAASAVTGVASNTVHAASVFSKGAKLSTTAIKAVAHGVSRAAIAKVRGLSAKAAFVSGFMSSAFDVGTKGNGGFIGRTAIMGIVGGTASALGGGKFSNGAMSGAFTHMFNAEGGSIKKSFESLAKGLYNVGDYLGRITGFRDAQVDSVGLGKNYYRNQARTERAAVYELGSHLVENPSASIKALSMYYNQNSAQMDTNTLVNFYTGIAVPFVGAISLSGNIMAEAHEINQVYNNQRN